MYQKVKVNFSHAQTFYFFLKTPQASIQRTKDGSCMINKKNVFRISRGMTTIKYSRNVCMKKKIPILIDESRRQRFCFLCVCPTIKTTRAGRSCNLIMNSSHAQLPVGTTGGIKSTLTSHLEGFALILNRIIHRVRTICMPRSYFTLLPRGATIYALLRLASLHSCFVELNCSHAMVFRSYRLDNLLLEQ